MSSKELQDSFKLTTPNEFTFPFPPYGIQLELMKNLYNTIEEKKIGIFESPTGTGKSLSIICGALTWLRDHEQREIRELESSMKKVLPKEEKPSDWLSAQINARANNAIIQQIQQKLDRINLRNDNIRNIRERVKTKKSRVLVAKHSSSNDSLEKENEFDHNDENELGDLIEEFIDTLKEVDVNLEESDHEEENEEQIVTRIIYCSRTHSQLSQFIHEIQKTCFSSDIRLVHLASRQNYCINKKFKDINNVSTLNEKCLELQLNKEHKTTLTDKEGVSVKRQRTGGGAKCPHMKGIDEFGEMILSETMDVESVVQSSKKTGACPYYALRKSIPLAQIIVVPYHTLLHKDSREASGLCLENSVIIIDEAHNLLETISHIHSAQITGQHLILAHSQLSRYRDKYETKFSPTNLLYLNQLIYVINALIKLIQVKNINIIKEIKSEDFNSQLYKVADFVMTAEIDNYNLYKILAFCKQSKLFQKLQRFNDKSSLVKVEITPKKSVSGIKEIIQGIKNQKTLKKNKTKELDVINTLPNPSAEGEEVISQPLLQVTSFLSCLTQQYHDGRVVVSKSTIAGKSTIKYLLLEPAAVIRDVINKARSVILAGGTMEPVSEFKERLFGVCGVMSDRIVQFSCGHVIPKENILPIVVCTGPSGKQLDFSYHHRSTKEMLNEIGRLLINVCNVVPAGVVCFFPSYEYENDVFNFLEKNGIIKSISNKKKVFREPKKSSEVDKVLSEYSAAIENSKDKGKINGSLLFSVVGGKLSEGLNFSDDLGRCVIVIGMPYPNMKSPELQEKIKYLEEHCGPNAGKIHYENQCMKAVNQSVGRSIRHSTDYSSVLLVDHRYSRASVCKLLPKWMQESLKIERDKFGPVLGQLCKFFKFHGGKSVKCT